MTGLAGDAGADGCGQTRTGAARLRGRLEDVAYSDWLVPLRVDELIWSVDLRSNGLQLTNQKRAARLNGNMPEDYFHGGAMAGDSPELNLDRKSVV